MKKNYSELLKDPRWQKKRLQILNRDKFKCKLCRDDKTQLQVHHLKYENGKDPWNYPNDLLITVCSDCHNWITNFLYDNEIDNVGFLIKLKCTSDKLFIYKDKDIDRLHFTEVKDNNLITRFSVSCKHLLETINPKTNGKKIH